MRIIVALDILEGKCVRLTKGDFKTSKVYHENPLEVAGIDSVLGNEVGLQIGQVVVFQELHDGIAVRLGWRIAIVEVPMQPRRGGSVSLVRWKVVKAAIRSFNQTRAIAKAVKGEATQRRSDAATK